MSDLHGIKSPAVVHPSAFSLFSCPWIVYPCNHASLWTDFSVVVCGLVGGGGGAGDKVCLFFELACLSGVLAVLFHAAASILLRCVPCVCVFVCVCEFVCVCVRSFLGARVCVSVCV